MEIIDFTIFVIPLGSFVFVLAPMVFYYARREERAKKKLVKTIKSYTQEKREKKKILALQLERLQARLRDKTIDKNTYERFKEILETKLDRQLAEAREQLPAKI